MRKRLLTFFAFLLFNGVCHAGVSATVIIYQPIFFAGEATAVVTPKGFKIMPIPYDCFHYHGRQPFDAITQSNQLFGSRDDADRKGDSNLLSSAGVTIEWSIDDHIVHVHLEKIAPEYSKHAYEEDITEDDIAEATLECIRLTAQRDTKRPTLKIIGKKRDEAKWLRWQNKFNKNNLTKPFERPKT